MDKSVASYGRLEVSVSFGKFDNDSLSWEKFSTFSPNKYLEEVEKCATPGSVAEKKAYFEAHYKKIAARKAEQLDQEKHQEATPQEAGDEGCQDSVLNDGEFGYAFSCKSSVEGDPRENDVLNDLSCIHVDKSYDDLPITTICENLPVEEARKQVNITDGSLTEDRPVLVKEEEEEREISSMEPHETKELRHIRNNEIIPTVGIKREKKKFAGAKESQKVTPSSKGRNVVNKKPITKLPHITTLKVSKPAANTSSVLASRSSTKRTMGAPSPKSRMSTAGQSKRDVSKSLHASFSLGPSNSDQAPFSSTRRSFIMEQMGDKDIVKRAFKSFQNSVSQSKSSYEDVSSAPKQMSTKGKQPKVYAPMIPQKVTGSSLKEISRDKKDAKAAPVPYGLKSDEQFDKPKKPTKKLVSNSQAKEAERTRIQAKTKGDNYSDIRKPRQNFNIKPLPVSRLHRGGKLSKSSLDEG